MEIKGIQMTNSERRAHGTYDPGDWLDTPEQVTPDQIAKELREIERMIGEGDVEEALFREAALHGRVLTAIHLGLVSGDVATLCARRAIKVTKDSFRLLP